MSEEPRGVNIDRNPVSAGLASRAVDYAYGSAAIYARSRSDEDDWLERSWVESEVCRVLQLPSYDPARYDEVFGRLSEDLARLVEARLQSRGVEDPLDDLIRAANETWKIGRRSGWLAVRVGLTRQLCGLRLEEIGERVGLARSGVSNLARLHTRMLASDDEFARRAGSFASRALRVWEGGGK